MNSNCPGTIIVGSDRGCAWEFRKDATNLFQIKAIVVDGIIGLIGSTTSWIISSIRKFQCTLTIYKRWYVFLQENDFL